MKTRVDAAALASALSFTEMNQGVAQLLAECFTQFQSKQAASPATARTLNIGQLVSMDWKLGVAVQSSSCKALRVPYVSLVMRVADQEGNIESHPMELTVPEFQVRLSRAARLYSA